MSAPWIKGRLAVPAENPLWATPGAPGSTTGCYAVNLGLILGLFAATRRSKTAPGPLGLGLLFLGGGVGLALSGFFLVEVAGRLCSSYLITIVPTT